MQKLNTQVNKIKTLPVRLKERNNGCISRNLQSVLNIK